MQLRKITYTEANLQADIFVKSLSVVMEIPGDWHASMSMLTSIHNLYYDGFLDCFQELLKWKRIHKDVRSCYFQAMRLTTFVHDELMRFFIHQFVSSRIDHPSDATLNDTQIIGKVTSEFMEFWIFKRRAMTSG